MAMSKSFVDGVLSLAKRGAELAEKLQSLGADAVKSAYSNKDTEKAQFLLDNIPQYMRRPLASWFKRAGVDIFDPLAGSARYLVQGVIDTKRQSKAFDFVEKNAVLVVEAQIKQPKVEKPLEGTPAERAAKKIGSLISGLRERDPETAALINETWAGKPTLCLIDQTGDVRYLTPEQFEVVQALLDQRERSVKLAA
jgi:hypothetical protein